MQPPPRTKFPTVPCRTASAFTAPSEEGATAAGGFSRRFIPPGYRLPGCPSPGTPKILMLSHPRASLHTLLDRLMAGL